MTENLRVISGPKYHPAMAGRVVGHGVRRVDGDVRYRVRARDEFAFPNSLAMTPFGVRVSDADQLGFLISQTALIKTRIYQIMYPDVDFARLVPVSTDGTGWESGIQHFTQDIVGSFKAISPQDTTLPLIQLSHAEHLVKVATYGAALKFNIQEVMQAMMIPGLNLRTEQDRALRRVHDQTHWDLVLRGRADLGWNGLINSTSIVTSVDSPANGSGNSRHWSAKSAENIILDINNLLEGIYVDSNTVEMADTLALPPNIWAALASRFIQGTNSSVAMWIKANNVYTMKTGRPLTILEIRGLENAAAGNTGRVIAYRNAEDVLQYHLLMPLNLFDPQYQNFDWCIPAMSRTGGLEIKRPGAVRYMDEISA